MCFGPVMLDFVYELLRFDLYDSHLMSSVLIFSMFFTSL